MATETLSATVSRNSRCEALAAQNRAEHAELLSTIHALEAALASAAPGREREWNEQVGERLRAVIAALRAHACSAEAEDGLFAEIDLRPTLLRRVERLRQEHADLVQQSEALAQRISHCNDGDARDCHDIRQRAAWLLTALRHHQAVENDLVFESFYTDLGVGD
jgi:hemerythrin-like domain-containing protein